MIQEIEKKIKGNKKLSKLWNQVVVVALQLCSAKDKKCISKLEKTEVDIDVAGLENKSKVLLSEFSKACQQRGIIDAEISSDQLLKIATEAKIS